MKKFLMALVVLAIASGPALAGPNENGVLMVHNTGVTYSTDPFPTVLPTCPEIVNTVAMGSEGGLTPSQSVPVVWKVYAVFPPANSPILKALGWGYNLSAVNGGGIIIEQNGAAPGVFSIISAGWAPATTGIPEVGMSFTDSCRVAHVTELWWFSGYAYAGALGEPQMFSLQGHTNPLNQIFSDCVIPANKDAIAGYGSLGFGQPGYTFCPTGEVVGPCCFTDGTCQMLTAVACQGLSGSFVGGEACTPQLCPVIKYGACCKDMICQVVTSNVCFNIGGTYSGDDTTCDPYPCAVPVEVKSWGQIKSSYR